MSHVPVETSEEDAADLQFPKGTHKRDNFQLSVGLSSFREPALCSVHRKPRIISKIISFLLTYFHFHYFFLNFHCKFN